MQRVLSVQLTFGIEYTKEPNGLKDDPAEGSVVVKNTILDLLRRVSCTWRMTCGRRGIGTASDSGPIDEGGPGFESRNA